MWKQQPRGNNQHFNLTIFINVDAALFRNRSHKELEQKSSKQNIDEPEVLKVLS